MYYLIMIKISFLQTNILKIGGNDLSIFFVIYNNFYSVLNTSHFKLKVEIWMADPSATYRKECVGYVMTDSRGFYSFTSAMPGVYAGRPQHIHYQITTTRNVKVTAKIQYHSVSIS